MNNVVIYARVSKEEEGYQNPENQLVSLRKFAEAMGWTIKHEYIDYASGGNPNRPQFQEMMKEVRQRHIDLILVWALDRFSREGIHNTLAYIKTLNLYKCNLKSIQESWLDTRESGVAHLLLSIFAWVAEEERRKISQRTKAALKRLKAQGKKLGRPKKNSP